MILAGEENMPMEFENGNKSTALLTFVNDPPDAYWRVVLLYSLINILSKLHPLF